MNLHALTRLHKKMRLAPKVFLVTFVLLETLVLLLGYSYQTHSARTLLTTQKEYAKQMVHQSDEYLRLNLQYISSFMTSIVHDSRFTAGDDTEIRRWFNDNLIYFIPNVTNIHVLEHNASLLSTSPYNWTLADNAYLQERLHELTPSRRVQWIGPYASLVSGQTVSAALPIPDAGGEEKLLLIDLDLGELYERLLPDDASMARGELLLMDNAFTPIYGRKPYVHYDVFDKRFELQSISPDVFTQLWNDQETVNGDGRDIFLTRSHGNPLGWQLVWVMDRTELLRPLEQSTRFAVILASASVLLSLLIAYLISAFISRPIRLIASSVQRVGSGDFDIAVELNRQDELGQLARYFNLMTRRIRELIGELKRTEARKQQSAFRALQAQINPHFLYNTLNTISMAAREGETRKIDELIASLTNQLQYSLDASPQPVALREELLHLENYAVLMMNRYPDSFTLDLDIDPLTLSCTVPKFILQPLAENAIFHGLVPKKTSGTLFICTYVEETRWRLIVEDDGVGMTPAKLEELRRSLAEAEQGSPLTGGHIGLRNVHQRLSMRFGEQYAMEIESREGEGTRLALTLPLPHDHLPAP
ncbi:sensor histidine kinase [Paenibacillus sp. IB182496]|uniref:Sensor histidine kinase n=1 Tax=Paenibacillus sabuli TaxID=2772509 RepID=A0A927GUD6_9BACL|nr:sensor histidine kinase [Paenibacillus sabuli]MBD2847592.1 sensor histidine kinase [Paenibacillus sabuli]